MLKDNILKLAQICKESMQMNTELMKICIDNGIFFTNRLLADKYLNKQKELSDRLNEIIDDLIEQLKVL